MTVFTFWHDPHGLKPWKFPEEGKSYRARIISAPYVAYRMDLNNAHAQRTLEGARRWALWMSVEAEDGEYGFCIQTNQMAKAFGGNATERNLKRWAERWKIGGHLTIRWTKDDSGVKVYEGRYVGPAGTDSPTGAVDPLVVA